MPDRWNFDHLPNWGIVTHRCIEEGCAFEGTPLTDDERRRHFETHDRVRRKAAKRAKNQALHRARQAAAETRRINKIVYGNRQKGDV